jgi:hypothetical protein
MLQVTYASEPDAALVETHIGRCQTVVKWCYPGDRNLVDLR